MFHVHFSKRHVAICLAMLALVCAAFGKAEAEEQTAIDIQSYELRIDLDLTHTSYDIAENSLHGTAQITLRNRSGAPIVSLPVVLNRLLKLKTATDGDHRPLDIDQHLTELKDWENFQVRAASIHLKMPLAPDQTMRLTLTYEGALASYQESGMDYVRDRLDPAFTILRPENVSYPMFAEPTAASVQARWGSEADVFDQRLIVTVPKGERVIYSGRLVAEGKNEKTATFDYASQKPSGFFITAIAPYAELQRGRSRVLFFEQDRNNAEQFADAMVRGAEVLTSWFGPMPSSSGGIEVVEIPENYGSQTISPMIIQTADAFGQFNPLYHELSHLWDIRSTDPAPARWEEGLAMFVASLVEVQADHKTAARDEAAKKLFARAQHMLEQDASVRTLPMAAYGVQHKTDFSYSVGGVFFALLYQAIGQEKFLDFVHSFRHTNAKGASFAMFANAVRALGSVPNRLADDFLTGTAGIDKLRAAHNYEELQAQYRD